MASRSRGADKSRGRDQKEEMKRKLGLMPFPGGDGEDSGDDGDLEAELAALVGDSKSRSTEKHKVSARPLEDIARMAAACMRDEDEDADEDTDLENDADLLAELQEVMEETEVATPQPTTAVVPPHAQGMVSLLESRVSVYTEAVSLARSAGESAKVRRLERGLKTCEDLLRAARSGRSISEEDIPPPVATGKSRENKPGPDLKLEPGPQPGPKPGQDLKPEPGLKLGPKSEPDLKPEPAFKPGPKLGLDLKPEPALKPGLKTGPDLKPEPRLKPELKPKPEPGHKADPKVEQRPEPATRSRSESSNASLLLDLRQRQKAFYTSAVSAKKCGDMQTAMACLRTAKSFDAVIAAQMRGEPVDLSLLPPPPPPPPADVGPNSPPSPKLSNPEPETKSSSLPVGPNSPPSTKLSNQEPETKSSSLPDTPLSALETRLSAYRDIAAEAKKDGNASKARRHERIATLYVDAIKALKAGKPVNFTELPSLPSFPPIPGVLGSGGEESLLSSLSHADREMASEESGESGERTPTHPVDGQRGVTPTVNLSVTPDPRAQGKVAPRPTQSGNKSASTASTSSSAVAPTAAPTAASQQEQLLLRRRQLLHAAALRCKARGDLDGAKALLRQRKGVEALLAHSRGGLPIDISTGHGEPETIPETQGVRQEYTRRRDASPSPSPISSNLPAPPPLPDSEFEFVSHREARDSETHHRVYSELSETLKEQHQLCQKIAQQFTAVGNVSETLRYEEMEDQVKAQLESLHERHHQGLPPPPARREERTLRSVRINDHLSESELELIIIKGTNLPAPSGYSQNDLNSFVKFEFPFPSSDQPQSDKTHTVKSSCNPEYNAKFCLNIVRTNRTFRRLVANKGIRLELYHKRLIKSDLIATAQFRVERLETHCEVRANVELLEGRRPSGGHLEVDARLREPLSGPQFATSIHSWLVVDKVPLPAPAAAKQAPGRMWSLELLRHEKRLCEAQMSVYRGRGQRVPSELQDSAHRITERAERQKRFLASGGAAARKDYAAFLKAEYSRYSQEMKRCQQAGDKDGVNKAAERVKLIHAEFRALQL